MRYEIPKSLKRHSFWCDEVKDFINFNKCTNYCSKGNKEENKKCWENSLRKDLIMDCDVTNEKNAEDYASCPNCQSDNIVGCAFNSFLCSQCGASFSLDKAAQKQCLGEQYQEIDDEALKEMFSKIKLTTSLPQQRSKEPIFDRQPKIGRNEPCPCGSGRKHKNCCGKK